MTRNKQICIFIGIVIIVFTALITIFLSQPEADELIERYFTIRYDNVNSSNLLKKVEKLSEFYSEDLEDSESWLTNTDNIQSTFETMETYGTYSELSLLKITDIAENRYQATIYVLYNTADKNNTHYVYYFMEVETVVENNAIRINDIKLLEQIPVFTGGMEMNLDSIIHEIEEIHKNHNHHEQ